MQVNFYFPQSIEQALSLKKDIEDACFLGGGTELNAGNHSPQNIISLQALDDLQHIREESSGLSIGALVTVEELIENLVLDQAGLGSFKDACLNIKNRNIRNMATIGGNIVANKSCSDLVPSLIALNAFLILADTNGESNILLEEYVLNQKMYTNALLKRIYIPSAPPNNKLFIKRFSRTNNDLAIINVAIATSLNAGKTEIRAAIGGCAQTPQRYPRIENTIAECKQHETSDDIKQKIGAAVLNELHPLDDIRGTADFKREIVSVFLAEITEKIISSDIE